MCVTSHCTYNNQGLSIINLCYGLRTKHIKNHISFVVGISFTTPRYLNTVLIIVHYSIHVLCSTPNVDIYPFDTTFRLERFLEKAGNVLEYFEPYLGRIEITGMNGRIERVYFEITQSNIDQWEKPQIKVYHISCSM